MLAMHVDDLMFLGPKENVETFFAQLQKEVLIREVGRLENLDDEVIYLGKTITRTRRGFELRANDKLIESYIRVCGAEGSKGVDTPIVKHTQIQEEQAELLEPHEYTPFRSKLGKLLALSHDRPDVQFAAMMIARHAAAPTSLDMWRLKRVARYLVAHPRLANVYEEMQQPKSITVWVDADWAGDTQSRRSTSGGVLRLGRAPLRTWSRVQPCVALSTAESEYYALCMGAQEGILAQQLALELSLDLGLVLKTDSAAARQATEKIGALR